MNVCEIVANGKIELLTNQDLKPFLPILSLMYYNSNSTHLFSLLQKYSQTKVCLQYLETKNWKKVEKLRDYPENIEYKFENSTIEERVQ
jgi:hypothetical protein